MSQVQTEVSQSAVALATANHAWLASIQKATERRDDILERSEAIERVAGESSQQSASNLLGEIQSMLSAIEKDRVAAKAPFKKAGEEIDDRARTFVSKLESEKLRLKSALGKFTGEQLRIKEAAERKQAQELANLQAERKAAELVAQHAATEKEQQKAQEDILAADLKAADVVMSAPVTVAKKAANTAVTTKWVAVVNDIHALYKVFPDCVQLTAKMREINNSIARLVATDPNVAPAMPGCTITKEVEVRPR